VREPLDDVLSASDLVAVLGREVPVRVVDISSAGCLLESASRLDKGATGLLRVTFGEVEYADQVRVMRCLELEGGSGLYRMGAEFLWTTSPDVLSLRRVIARLQGAVVRKASFERQM
jgi:hypothetical protein